MKRTAASLLLSSFLFPHSSSSPPLSALVCPSIYASSVYLSGTRLLLDLQKADENPGNEFHNLCKCDTADLQRDYAVLLDYYRHT